MEAEERLDLKKIQNLTDATFAVAMTLLILEIRMPHGLSSEQFGIYFFNHLSSDIFIYIIGFITLGIFWIGSHYHHNILVKTDRISSWLNIFFLMTICLIPYCISLIRNYKEEKLNILFYSTVLIIASLFNLSMIIYAWKKKHTTKNYTLSHYKNAKLRMSIPIAIYAANMFICLLSVKLSLWIFLAPILLHILPEKYGTSIKY